LGSAEGLSALKEIDDYLLSYSFPKELSYMFPKEIILLVDKVKIIQVESTNQSFTIVKEPKASEQTGYGKKESCKITKQFGGQESPEESNYLVFRTSVTVDDDVRLDPDTERVRRSEITERDIGLVFQLDCDGNIMPLEGTLSGVYSFLPIEGEQTGMPFGIFGDFIPSPGRDQINYSAKWNQWMCQQIVIFFKTVVENELLENLHFKFFPAQAFDDIKYSSRGGPFWNANLRQPILDFLSGIPIFADENQDLHKQNELFKVKPDVSNLFSTETLQKAIGKKLPHPSLLDLQLIKQNIPEIGIYDVLHNKELIESIKNDTEKLISLYGQIEKLENYWIKGRPQGRGTRDVPLRLIPFVLGNDNQLHAPEQVKLLQDIAEIPPFIDMGKINTKIPLHTEIAKNETAVSQLKRCDMEVIGIQKTIDNVKDLVHDISNNPSYLQLLDTLVEASLWLIAHDVSKLDKLLDQSGTLQLPENVFIPYGHLDWQPLWDANMLPGYFPLSSKYFELAGKYGLEVEAMKQCLQEMKVHGFSKEYDARLITVAGETIAEKYLESKGHIPKNVTDHDKLGYDLYCQGHCNQVFEVKGMSEPSDVSLQASQVDKAKELGEKYILVCVYNIPEDPTKIVFKEIPDPQQIWVAEEKARVPKKKWLKA
jgi:hypothetical protein